MTVFKATSDILCFVTGNEDCEEVSLLGIIRAAMAALTEASKKQLSEATVIEAHAQLQLAIDELINRGVLEQVDPKYVYRMGKLELKQGD